ncbi:MAG TPA: UbiA family prenyltransferase [Bacteroidia bacterium]|nr:UbiA family prenyltransferase [Bacteroidia bacterium]
MNASTFQLGHHWILAITAAAYVTSAMHQLPPGNVDFALAWLIGAGTFLVYRLSIWQPVFNTVERRIYLQKSPSKLELFLLAFSLILPSFLIDLKTLLFAGFTGIISTFYYFRLTLKNKAFGGLRIIPAFKNIFLAASWSFSTVYIPYLFVQASTPVLFLFLSRFIFILAVCFGVDMRDVQRDKKSGTKTLAVLLGFNQTKFIAIILSAVFIALTLSAKQIQLLPLRSDFEHYSLIFTGLLLIGILFYLKPSHKTSTYSLLLDGCMFLQAILLVAG